MPIPLAPTKLAVPRARPGLIHRARLLDLAVLGFAGPLTLVSAPPGWGKTTLLLQALERHAGPWAWLTVDPADNDPARFVRYLGAALGTVSPSAGTAAEQLLEADGITPAVFVQHLIPELDAQTEDCVLVLDDVHVLDQPSVLDGCRLLVEHLPPRLHLVLGTREDPPLPLARLRARGVLTEIRAADLRFTPEEAHMFLTGTMGLNLPADDAVVLAERTEGWAAGLQLAALSLRGRDNPQAFVRAFAGSHRYVGAYLVDEVLARQPPDLQDFLLRTAILERLSGPLCQALTTRDDSQSVLEHLERANLFVVSLDDQRRWYRYHQLFGDLLRSRLAATRPAEIPALHLRASTWHEREAVGGELEHVLEAIHHALAAGDVERTAHLLDSAAGLLLAENQQLTLLAWLEQLPESVLCAHAGLAIAHAWALTLTGGPAMLRDRRLDDAEHALLAPRTDEHPASIEEHASALGNIALLRGYAARERGILAAARARTQEALRLLPPEQAVTRTGGHLHLGVVASMTGELDEAERHLRQAARLGIGGANRHAALAAR